MILCMYLLILFTLFPGELVKTLVSQLKIGLGTVYVKAHKKQDHLYLSTLEINWDERTHKFIFLTSNR